MDFGGFLGNDGLKNRLTAALAAGKTSHCYLFSCPRGSGKHTLARLLAAALQCTSDGEKPCRQCAQCRKVLADAHPDLVAAQNALLKVMEEPPDYGVFLLLADRAEGLLPTVRSRCEELTLSPVREGEAMPLLRREIPNAGEDDLRQAFQRSGGFVGQALDLLRSGGARDERAEAIAAAYAAGDRLTLAGTLCKMEKLKREQLFPILQQTQALVAEALAAKARRQQAAGPAKALAEKKTAAVLLTVYRDLQQAMDAANAKVGVGHVCGFLASRLR